MTVSVCVGSACHLKGSYRIIELLRARLKETGLEETVDLKAAFCLGRCSQGVTMKVDDEFVLNVSTENFDQIFNQYILKQA